MALPSTGQISMSQVNTELGLATSTLISLNQSSVRTLAGISTGQIAMSDLWGKSSQTIIIISANQTNLDLRTYALANGWDGSAALVITINSGIIINSVSSGSPALTVTGSFPSGVTIVNNGGIYGKGSDGAAGGSGGAGAVNNADSATAGGTALSVTTAVSITNNGTIAGGGGGGGGGAMVRRTARGLPTAGGGGGGGGQSSPNSAGGAAGTGSYVSGGAGDPGGGAGPGGGGAGGNGGGISAFGGAGGTGGTWGSGGASGGAASSAGGANGAPGSGGSAGSCTVGNSFITWTTVGTRLGPLN